MQHAIEPIAIVRSPFRQKFGIPHQPGLAPSLKTYIELRPPFNDPDTVRGLEQATHIWLLFLFSETLQEGWKPTIRPPRLGGKTKLGVFATRAPHRPNGIGMSVVKLDGMRTYKGSLQLVVSGADLLDGTPVVDIKPYLPNSDQIADARYPLASDPAPRLQLPVHFTEAAQESCRDWEGVLKEPLQQQITELLQCDPRPAHDREKERVFGVSLYHLNIRWRVLKEAILVESLEEADGPRLP